MIRIVPIPPPPMPTGPPIRMPRRSSMLDALPLAFDAHAVAYTLGKMPDMSESLLRAGGAALTVAYAVLIGWLAASQPQSLVEGHRRTGGDVRRLRSGRDQFRRRAPASSARSSSRPARTAWSRADPAGRDARTQFYVAYSYYRQGWGRVSHDDALYAAGLDALATGGRGRPGGRVSVSDPEPADPHRRRARGRAASRPDAGLVRPESAAGLQEPQVTPAREAFGLPLTLLTVVLLGGIRLTSPVAIRAADAVLAGAARACCSPSSPRAVSSIRLRLLHARSPGHGQRQRLARARSRCFSPTRRSSPV